eukprot:TRINITY_DN15630_c0_g2_i2.p2 TRINITY_DN15630_c0_g2~~TRINITY_DN15630_c0_g2_i2.p2  ORF type:complete len:172 (+),score=85.85 TRINITY_DN15630_c0_g2_i2:78-593(+)
MDSRFRRGSPLRSPEAGLGEDAGGLLADLAQAEQVLLAGRGRAADVDVADFDPSQPPIIPFHLSAAQGVKVSDDPAADADAKLFDLTPEAVAQIKEEAGDYINNLQSTLAAVHQHRDRKLRRRLRTTSQIPLTFLYLRTLQASLKLTDQLDVQRQKRILYNLQELFDTPKG